MLVTCPGIVAPTAPRCPYHPGRLSGPAGCIVSGVTTVVEFRGSFRLMESDGDRLRRTGRGTWFDRCGEQAIAEHTNPKCDICARGGSCGLDCTLSKLSCPRCGATA